MSGSMQCSKCGAVQTKAEKCILCGEAHSELVAPHCSEESTQALLMNRYGPKVRPIAYVCHLPRISAVAREHGYALAVHGSLQRDMDLIAVPWSEVAADAEQLVQAICETAGAFILAGQDGTAKPHGRVAYVLQLGAGLYIDLGVMPRLPQND